MGKIQLKHGQGTSTPGSLASGEFAINIDSNKLWYGNNGQPVSKLHVESQIIDANGHTELGSHSGEVLRLGNSTTTVGAVYGLVNGTWEKATAETKAIATAPLAISTHSGQGSDMLTNGIIYQHSVLSTTQAPVGTVLYIHTVAGKIHHLPPSGSGEIIRAIGFVASGSNVIFFKPDTTWLELV